MELLSVINANLDYTMTKKKMSAVTAMIKQTLLFAKSVKDLISAQNAVQDIEWAKVALIKLEFVYLVLIKTVLIVISQLVFVLFAKQVIIQKTKFANNVQVSVLNAHQQQNAQLAILLKHSLILILISVIAMLGVAGFKIQLTYKNAFAIQTTSMQMGFVFPAVL